MTQTIMEKLYGAYPNEEEIQKRTEIEKYMLLHNYIDKYQEKLGLYNTKRKKTEVEKVLALTKKN